jgi:hypothetical protein
MILDEVIIWGVLLTLNLIMVLSSFIRLAVERCPVYIISDIHLKQNKNQDRA